MSTRTEPRRFPSSQRVYSLVLGSVLAGACCSDGPKHAKELMDNRLSTGRAGTLARPALCDRTGRDDAVRDLVCAEARPRIAGLADLQAALHIEPDGFAYDALTNTRVTMLGHSTAPSGHKTSPLNPRLIIVGNSLFMAFQRGVQKVEVIATARNPGFFNFYLFQFEQACNAREAGCSPGDLYTSSVERDWLSVTVKDDEDLKNTPSDCRPRVVGCDDS